MKFFAVLALCLIAAAPAVSSRKISNGIPAVRGQFPYQALLNVTTAERHLICSGAVISKRWIVTAGHCIASARNATITVGSNSLIGKDWHRYTTNATKYVLPDGYHPSESRNDIGLVRTANNLYYLSGSAVSAIALPKYNVTAGASVVVSGWGITRDRGQRSNDLLFTSLRVISNKQCTDVYYDLFFNKNILCTTSNSSFVRGICYGDIGAPLVGNLSTKAVLVGVGNFYSDRGKGCERGDPSGFTTVFPFVSWIKKVTGL